MAKVVTTMDVAARNRVAHLGADQALPRMMKEHERFVFSICLAYCGDEDRARDLTQETFLRAYRSWESFEGRSSVSTWLYTIARRTCFRLERRRAGEPRHKVDVDSIGERVPAADAVPESDYAGFDPLEHLIEEETAELVRRAISHLPIRYRLPLVLKELGGLYVQDVATLLHLSEGTLKSRLFRARALLEPELVSVLPPEHTSSTDGRTTPTNRGALSTNGHRASAARGSARSDRLCPSCRPVFGSEARAAMICETVLDGDVSASLAFIIQRELSTEASRHAPTTSAIARLLPAAQPTQPDAKRVSLTSRREH